MIQSRARPEDFLELVARTRRGRLKLYLGFAAGVGKTYRMLEEAHALRIRGVDVVIAYVETHGRAETARLIEGIEVVPRKRIEHRGVEIEELDLEAVLARRPAVAIVDEIPHTNAPGQRNRKRWEDVLSLIEAGINVVGAMNVQHLESLNELITRVTGVVVRETVPDRFLQGADQVVNLDLAVEDLQDRLKSGKIYAADKVEDALANFFRDQNLSSLRELALREVAEKIERRSEERAPGGADAVPRLDARRVLVAVSSASPRTHALLRRGSRAAGRLGTDWYAVYVETPDEAPNVIDAGLQRRLLESIELARQLGAEVVRLRARDPVRALVDFARGHGVGLLIIGRSHQPWWRQVFGRSVPLRLVREADDLDVQIVGTDEGER